MRKIWIIVFFIILTIFLVPQSSQASCSVMVGACPPNEPFSCTGAFACCSDPAQCSPLLGNTGAPVNCGGSCSPKPTPSQCRATPVSGSTVCPGRGLYCPDVPTIDIRISASDFLSINAGNSVMTDSIFNADINKSSITIGTTVSPSITGQELCDSVSIDEKICNRVSKINGHNVAWNSSSNACILDIRGSKYSFKKVLDIARAEMGLAESISQFKSGAIGAVAPAAPMAPARKSKTVCDLRIYTYSGSSDVDGTPTAGTGITNAAQLAACKACMEPTSGIPGVWTSIGCVYAAEPYKFVFQILTWAVLLGAGFTTMIIGFQGFQIVMNGDDPKKIKASQEAITSAIAGLLMIVFSIMLMNFFGLDILNLKNLGFWN